MKILIDENLPVKLKYNLNEYEVFTVRDMNWNSVKNGQLLKLAVENSFNIFITSDKNLPFKQNIPKIGISIIILNVLLLKWSFIEPLIPKIKTTISIAENGNVYQID